MSKASKTWKIGEVCRGGIITVEVHGNKVDIINKEWDHSAGSKRSSNQSKAKEWDRLSVDVTDNSAADAMDDFLNDLTSYYYADEIMKYIRSKAEVNYSNRW